MPPRSDVATAGSGADGATPVAPMGHRPTTHLQHGISKPKTYSNGTVQWCMLDNSSIEEPLQLLMKHLEIRIGFQRWMLSIKLPCPKGKKTL